MSEKLEHTGIYVHGTPETALFTILLPDKTCGMFLMPTARDVFWLGFTTYKLEGNKLFFKAQTTEVSMDPSKPPAKKAATASGTPQFLEATLTVGKEYIQHDKQDTKFIFMSGDVAYWEKIGFKKLGEARHMKEMQDFDHAHEIRKVLVEVISRFGPVFIWA